MFKSLIGNLRVALGLDSAQFQSGLKNAKSNMGDFGKQAAAAFAGMAAAATVAFHSVQSAAGRAAEMKKFADVAGAGYEEFQRFAQGARMIGVENKELADVFKDVNDKLGDYIQTGAGPMADFFENIAPQVGVTAKELAKLSGPQALQAYYNALEKAGLSQSEMTFYMEAIASDATMLIPLLRKNGQEFSRLGDQAEALGLIMSEKTAASAKRFNENMRVLGLSMEGLWNSVLTRVVGGMEILSQRMASASKEGGGLRRATDAIAWGMNALMRGIGFVLDNLDTLYDLFRVFVAAKIVTFVAAAAGAFISLARTVRVAGLAVGAFTALTRAKITMIVLATAAIAKLTGQYDNLASWLSEMSDQLMAALPQELREGIDSLSSGIASLGAEITAVDGAVASSMDTFVRVSNSAKGSFGQAGKAAEKFKQQVADVIERTRTPLVRYQEEIGRLGEMLVKGAIDQETYNRAVAQAQDAFTQAEMSANSARGVMLRVAESISDAFSNAFAGLVDGSMKAKDVLRDLLSQFARMASNSVFQQLFNLGAGWIGGFGGGIPGLSSSTFSGWFKDGGRIPSGGWGIAGEAGVPEVITGPAKVWTPDMLRSHVDTSRANDNGPSLIYLRLAPGLQADILEQSAQQSVKIVEEYDRTQAPTTARRAVGAANRQSLNPDFRRGR